MRTLATVALLLTVLVAGCTKDSRDTDDDGLRDATERRWPDLIVDYMDRRVRLEDVRSDKDLADTDGDGLGDFDEFFSRTDPRDKDTDDDGLTDCQELVHSNASECEDPAYAGDYDGGFGTSAVRADSDPGPVRYMNMPGRFTDLTATLVSGRLEWGDGISDKDELFGYTIQLGGERSRFIQSDPRDPDSDNDGLEDGEEALQFESDPTVQDSDGDTCNDGQDAWPGREESFVLGLQTIRMKVDKDSSGSDIGFTSVIAGEVFESPVIHVGKDVEADVAALSPPPVRDDDCGVTPLFPWVKVQVSAGDPDATEVQNIDFTSLSGAPIQYPSIPAFYWNVRTDELSWDPVSSTRIQNPAVLEGVDAVLRLQPTVSFRQTS